MCIEVGEGRFLDVIGNVVGTSWEGVASSLRSAVGAGESAQRCFLGGAGLAIAKWAASSRRRFQLLDGSRG